jgi:hypothetical protein
MIKTNHSIWMVLMFCLSTTACGGDEQSSGGVLSLDSGPSAPAADMGAINPYADYCQRVSKAKCDYIFGCVGTGYIIQSLFALPGSTAARCAEQAAATCLEDVRDRDQRGTLDFTASAVDVCVEQMGSKPCRQNDPSEWAHQWHDFVANFCGGVARGNVQTGDTCMRRSDCIERHDICIEGACRHALPADLLASCTPTGTAGTLSQSEECKTGACINTGFGGNCTVDCRTGRGCVGDDLACVRLSVSGGPSNSFCLSTCTTDAQCDELVCQSIDPMDPMGDLYCLHAVAAAGQ